MMESACRSIHRMSRRSKRTRLPRSQDEMDSPLHVAGIPPMDVVGLRGRLTPRAQKRFDYVWATAFPSVARGAQVSRPTRRSVFRGVHADALVGCGVARRVDSGGPLENVPFTVVEEKESGLRQRFILWTKEANSRAADAGYVADIPLGHISEYLSVAAHECGSTRDFRTGFYAVEIPESARHLFRFQDAEGRWSELERLPMGHSCAPEIMHTLCAAAAGDPTYVSACWAAKHVTVHCWIDNIRYTGRREAVLRESGRLDETARTFACTWKAADTNTAASAYDFLGVTFDHVDQTVTPSAKLRGRLDGARLDAVSAGDIEALGGRLQHAGAIADVSPGSFWFALKFVRRVVNQLNRGLLSPSQEVSIPPSVRTEFESWRRAVAVVRPITAVTNRRSATVFVDASLQGWGGVIVDNDTTALTIVGGGWPPEQRGLHINVYEAKALALTVKDLPQRFAGGTVDVYVDNTSVQGVARKKQCVRNRLLNDAVITALARLRDLRVSFSVRYVNTKYNPADHPSRVDPSALSSPSLLRDVTATLSSWLTCDGVNSPLLAKGFGGGFGGAGPHPAPP